MKYISFRDRFRECTANKNATIAGNTFKCKKYDTECRSSVCAQERGVKIPLHVKKWVSDDDVKELEVSIGGLGGFFQKGMRWKDYVKIYKKKGKAYAEVLRKEITERGLKHGGDWHQNDAHGTPVFSDKTYASFSFRAWGDLLAAIWSEEEGKDYCYMDFYMECLI